LPAEPLQMVETKSTENAPETARVAGESPAEWGPPSNPRRRAKPKADEAAPEEPLVLVETRSAPRNETTTS
jgi:hypothetical protein